MTVVVDFATKLEASNPLFRYALPHKFPILVIKETASIIEPALDYLYSTHVASGSRRWNKNTTNADAYDLRDWFDFLEHQPYEGSSGKPWDLASHEDYLEYHEALQELVSRQTGRYLSDATITRRQVAVERFYVWAQSKALYVGAFIEREIKKGRRHVPKDKVELAHAGATPPAPSTPEGRHQSIPSEPIRPLTKQKWKLLRSELGPLPSERNAQEPRSSRSRLAGELCIMTGMRVGEVAQLSASQGRDLVAQLLLLPEEERERSYVPMRITKTKRMVTRNVQVPAYLVSEIELYLDGERAESTKVGRAFAQKCSNSFREPSSLFLNQAANERFAGKQVTTDTLQADFRTACIAAALVETEQRYDPDDPSQVKLVKVPAHSFHDTRHTFAVWKYHTEIANGNPEPWKLIQTLLGHKQLSVTQDIYLKVVDVERELAGHQQWNHHVDALRGGGRGSKS